MSAQTATDWQSLYRRMRNVAAGYSNYCDESGTTRKLEREFDQIDDDARAISRSALVDEHFKVPALGNGQIEYRWSTDCVVDIVCHLDFTPAEDAEPYGDAPYPGCHEDFTLCAAYVRGVDILPLLSEKQINQIEEAALIERAAS